jgi:hypothetical protein
MRMQLALIPINDEQGILNFEIFFPFIIRNSIFDIQNSIPRLPGRDELRPYNDMFFPLHRRKLRIWNFPPPLRGEKNRIKRGEVRVNSR